jgi:hypothetical protein
VDGPNCDGSFALSGEYSQVREHHELVEKIMLTGHCSLDTRPLYWREGTKWRATTAPPLLS